MTAETPAQEFPLRLGCAEDFARVELLLRSSSFDEPTLCRILGIESLSHLGSVKPDRVDLSKAESETLALLIRLFLLLGAVSREDVERVIDTVVLDAILRLDLLRTGIFDPENGSGVEKYYSTVLLYPVEGLFIASDRHKNPDGSESAAASDVVFPAIFGGTLRFLRVISKNSARNVLDLCSGTGVAALSLSRHAERAVASDITARSTHFAKFNRLLNRCRNVEVVQSDLYDSFGGRTFDRIVAHPPYVPALSSPAIFRDGGETGETLVRRIVEGIPNHLEPGGTFYCVCAGWDSKDGRFEARARNWIGESQSSFDIIFAFSGDLSPERLAKQLVERESGGDPSQVTHWNQLFGSAGMKKLVYGALVVHRRYKADAEIEEQPLTLRLQLGALTDGSSFEWALKWRRWRSRKEAAGDLTPAISQLRPRLGSTVRLNVTYVVEDGALMAGDALLECERPFPTATRVDLAVMMVMSNFDGNRAVKEVYEAARDQSALPETFSSGDFARLVADMIERGYLEIDSIQTTINGLPGTS